jgi:hypothetical protein
MRNPFKRAKKETAMDRLEAMFGSALMAEALARYEEEVEVIVPCCSKGCGCKK